MTKMRLMCREQITLMEGGRADSTAWLPTGCGGGRSPGSCPGFGLDGGTGFLGMWIQCRMWISRERCPGAAGIHWGEVLSADMGLGIVSLIVSLRPWEWFGLGFGSGVERQ